MTECQRRELNAKQQEDHQSNAADKLRGEAVYELARWGKDNFQQLDSDSNGFLTVEELTQKSPSSDNPKYGLALKSAVSSVQSLNNDEWGFENDGITKADLEALKQKALSMPDELAIGRNIRETFTRRFSEIDGGDQRISRWDLESAISSGQFTGCDLRALKDAEERFTEIGHKPSKTSRKIKEPHLEEYIGEVQYRYRVVPEVAKLLDK